MARLDGFACPICKGIGWLYAVDENGQVIWESGDRGQRTKLVRCTCRTGSDHERRRRRLLEMDGLTDIERQLTFDRLTTNGSGPAIDAVREAAALRRGLITLVGRPGTGKSTLLVCAVNAAREANVPAVYTTVTDLLDYLRAAYNPAHGELAFDARWDLLVRAEVLALDELDEFNTTAWASERFLRLMDERWRAMDRCLTLCACNVPLATLPDKVGSRLHDGRGRVIEMRGRDMRPFASW